MRMTRCSLPCLLIVFSIGRLPGDERRHLAESAACPEPAPVANAVRTVWQTSWEMTKARYTCVDGYVRTGGASTRRCNSSSATAGYDRTPLVCTLDCGSPRQVAVTTNNATDTLAKSLTEYTCTDNYRMPRKHNRTQVCDPVTAQWVAEEKIFCKSKLDLKDSLATQEPELDPGDPTSAQRALDKNVSTCSETAESNRPSWTVEVNKDEHFTITTVEFLMKITDAAMSNVSVKADVFGGLQQNCGRHNKTKATLVNGTLHGSIFCAGKVKPFGNNVTLTAVFDETGHVNSSLQLCDIVLKGGPYTATCNFPPRIPRLRLVTVSQTYFKTETVRYECEDQYTPFSGSGNSTCGLDAVWSFPSLACIDEEVIPVTTQGATTSAAGTDSVALDLGGRFEIMGVHLANVTQEIDVTLTLGPPPTPGKTCDDVTYTDNGVFVTCPYRPVTSRVTLNLPLDLYQAVGGVKVFGKGPFNGALECLHSARGEDYKGLLNYGQSGLPCLAWADVSLHSFTAADFPDDSVAAAGNRCRNPAMSGRCPWCYVQAANGTQRDDCDIFVCNQFCKVKDTGADYQGSKQDTIRGKKCLSWFSTNQPFVRPLDFPNGTMNHSKCRNPASSQSAPWCFVGNLAGNDDIEGFLTVDGSKLYYDLCDISSCPTGMNITLIRQSEALAVSALYDRSDTWWECQSRDAWHSAYTSLTQLMDTACGTRSADVIVGQPDTSLGALCRARSDASLSPSPGGSTPDAWTHFIVLCDDSLVTPTPTTTLSSSPLESGVPSDWSYDMDTWTTTAPGDTSTSIGTGSAWNSGLFSSTSVEEPPSSSSHWSEPDGQWTSMAASSHYGSLSSSSDGSQSVMETVRYSDPATPVSSEHSQHSDAESTWEYRTPSDALSQGAVQSLASVVFSDLDSVYYYPSASQQTRLESDMPRTETESWGDWSTHHVHPLSTAAAFTTTTTSSIQPSQSDSGQLPPPSSSSSSRHLSQDDVSTAPDAWSDDPLYSSQSLFSIQPTRSGGWSSDGGWSGDDTSSSAASVVVSMSMTAEPSYPLDPSTTGSSSFPDPSPSFQTTTAAPATTPPASSSAPRLCPQKCSCQPNRPGPVADDVASSLASSIRSELSLATHNLSRSVRKKTSASDNRASAVTIGSFGVVLLVSTFALIAFSDIMHGFKGDSGRRK